MSACGPRPYGRPMDQAASSATASQPEVDQRRDDVAAEEQHRDGVGDLGVRRIERREEDRVEEVDVAQVAGLHEPRRERQVVPEAVGAIHAGRERAERRHDPGRRQGGADPRRDSFATPHDGGAGGRVPGGPPPRPTAAPSPESPAPTPTTTAAAITGPRSKPPNVPTASETQINPTTPRTISANRAGGPSHPGSKAARTLYAPKASAARTRPSSAAPAR